MKTDQTQRKYLKEYQQPDFTIITTDLVFNLEPEITTVTSQLKIRRLTADPHAPLVLDGVNLRLVDLRIDEEYLDDSDYQYDGNELVVANVGDEFEFSAKVEIDPSANTALEGLYQSNGNYCSQCEAEGFRHITFYLDRPDVMSVFTTTIKSNKASNPIMLSNGNRVDQGESDGNHWVKWHDPFPKPCYLFALVAGDLACIEDSFTTRSGRKVNLEIYTEHHNKDKCDHAMRSLQKSMAWDEQVFGLEYDLDLYMIVAVDDFNMGAMENKGLNVFNTQYVLASQQTATDDNYLAIEGVIAHEYFHNWTGNRVTCRDWFQLSLKEGLTVFRDQEFSSDVFSRPIQRINDVRVLRAHQFTEDAGPMAHPVRPQSYLEINNFYTVTVYNKGAEVVRMYHSLLGAEGFRKGMDLYFERHDGQAVTTDDFRLAMQDANGRNLDQFQRWYDQSGTPGISIERDYDADQGLLKLRFSQQPGATKELENDPFLIPIRLALFDQQGQVLPLDEQGSEEVVIELSELEQFVEFSVPAGLESPPLVSALRGFSAPVNYTSDLSNREKALLMAFDSDPFNQWDAGQSLATDVMLQLIDAPTIEVTESVTDLVTAFGRILESESIEKPLLAEMLSLPGEKYLAEMCNPVDIQKIHEVREFLKTEIARSFKDQFLKLYKDSTQKEYDLSAESIGLRSLKNTCLTYLTLLAEQDYFELAERQYIDADNMTDQLGALSALVNHRHPIRQRLFDAFYHQWSDTALVVDKWFRLQASSQNDGALHDILKLAEHPAFNLKNPNRARSLIGAFQANSPVFHDETGQGYEFLADKIIELDSLNPQIASRMAHAFLNWKKLKPELAQKMKQQILRVQAKPDLSNDVRELMSSCLASEE